MSLCVLRCYNNRKCLERIVFALEIRLHAAITILDGYTACLVKINGSAKRDTVKTFLKPASTFKVYCFPFQRTINTQNYRWYYTILLARTVKGPDELCVKHVNLQTQYYMGWHGSSHMCTTVCMLHYNVTCKVKRNENARLRCP